MNKKQKTNLALIVITTMMMIALYVADIGDAMLRFCCYMVPYLTISRDVLKKAAKGILNRRPLDENFLMSIATVGAIILAVYTDGDYTEGIAVMLFYQIGELFQSCAVDKSRRSISELMDIRPDFANIEQDGKIVRVDPDEIAVGTTIIVQAGEKIPIDGTVIDGSSMLDTAALTGESVPREAKTGDEVASGCINLVGVLRIKTTKLFDESTVSKILELVENASSKKARSEAFITRFARVYTPAVVAGAVLLAVVPPLVRVCALGLAPEWSDWLYRALTFLVISCPCALVISIPLGFFAGLGGAGREGILVKGSNYLETLANINTVVFDKTGTLTKGVFDVAAVHADGIGEKELLHLAAHAEKYSAHPIAEPLKRAYPNCADDCKIEDEREIAGLGIQAKINGKKVSLGNAKLMNEVGAEWHDCENDDGTVIHAAVDGEYAGHIVISDAIKPTAREAIAALNKIGIRRTVMLTGDTEKTAAKIAAALAIDETYANLLPADKVAKIETLLADKNCRLAFVGDGINDAPALSRADVGIAMGALGSDAAIEAADVVLMDDDPLKIAKAIKIARKCIGIVKANIYFAIGIKIACLVFGALGLANMWLAIFADVGVMILAILNAIRAMFVKNL